MVVQQRKRAVGTFSSRKEAEAALNELKNSGFPMDRVSVLAKNSSSNDQIAGADVSDHGDNEAQEGAGIGAVAGTVLGGIGGLLVGLEALIIPGVGPFLAAGTIATTLAGAGIGAAAGSIVGALTGAGIPEEDAKAYGERVSHGDYLVMIEGSQDEIDRAGSILRNRNISNWKVYDTDDNRSYNNANVARATTNPDPETYRTATDHNTVEIVDKREQIR
jgi:hypothetical protein